MKKILATLLSVAFLVGCGQTSSPTNSAKNVPSQSGASLATNKVSMTASGFTPSTITISKGTTVTWTNTDSVGHWVASGPHPTHTDYPGFDAKKVIEPGQTYQFTFNKVGHWSYHDHLRPVTYLGQVVVTE